MATNEERLGVRKDIYAMTNTGTLIAQYYDISNVQYSTNNPHRITFTDKHGVEHQLVADVLHVTTYPDRKTAPAESSDYPNPFKDANPYL